MRLDKFIADATAYSRKEIKKLVRYRAVTVNGEVAVNADRQVNAETDVRINGKPVVYRKYIYLMLNKPQGYLSATEDKKYPVVTELVPENLKHFNVFPVGRLDMDTEGLLLLTNDGQLGLGQSPRFLVRMGKTVAIFTAAGHRQYREKRTAGGIENRLEKTWDRTGRSEAP